MKKLFGLNACRAEIEKSIINTDVTKEFKLFFSKSLSKINNKTNSSSTQVTFPLLLMLTLDKKLSFIQHLYFFSNNEVIKNTSEISIMTLIKGHGNCIKFHKSRIKILLIVNFMKKKYDLRFAHKSKRKIIFTNRSE